MRSKGVLDTATPQLINSFLLLYFLSTRTPWDTERQEEGIGTPCFTVLQVIVPHRCCIFYKLKARPTKQKDQNLLYCNRIESNLQYLQGLPVLRFKKYRYKSGFCATKLLLNDVLY